MTTTETLQEKLVALHPDFGHLTAENGTLEELGEGVINKLGDEYLRLGIDISDAAKLMDVTQTLGIDTSTALGINGQDGLRLQENFLAVNFLKMYVTDDPDELHNWLRTEKAGLSYASPIELVLADQLPKVVGYVFDASNSLSSS